MQNDLRIADHPILDIQKGRQISFQFNSRTITAYKGETIAAAFYASGVRIFSRSFKYHRPRGLFCMAGHCSNCLMRVDGVPNVRVCREPARQGSVVMSQNAWPSLKFDLAALDLAHGGSEIKQAHAQAMEHLAENRPIAD